MGFAKKKDPRSSSPNNKDKAPKPSTEPKKKLVSDSIAMDGGMSARKWPDTLNWSRPRLPKVGFLLAKIGSSPNIKDDAPKPNTEPKNESRFRFYSHVWGHV